MPCDRIAVSNETEDGMDVKQAVKIAKTHVTDLFADEGIVNVGLEEVEFNDAQLRWRVTIGFSRPWDHKNPLTAALGDRPAGRSYKVIHIHDTDGSVESLKDRILRDQN